MRNLAFRLIMRIFKLLHSAESRLNELANTYFEKHASEGNWACFHCRSWRYITPLVLSHAEGCPDEPFVSDEVRRRRLWAWQDGYQDRKNGKPMAWIDSAYKLGYIQYGRIDKHGLSTTLYRQAD